MFKFWIVNTSETGLGNTSKVPNSFSSSPKQSVSVTTTEAESSGQTPPPSTT